MIKVVFKSTYVTVKLCLGDFRYLVSFIMKALTSDAAWDLKRLNVGTFFNNWQRLVINDFLRSGITRSLPWDPPSSSYLSRVTKENATPSRHHRDHCKQNSAHTVSSRKSPAEIKSICNKIYSPWGERRKEPLSPSRSEQPGKRLSKKASWRVI